MGGLLAVHLTSAPVQFGPHRANTRLEFDDRVTFDLGPIGSVAVPAQLPLGAGVEIELRDIPSVAGSPRSTLTDDDVQAYASLYANPSALRSGVEHALVRSFLVGAAIAFLVSAALYVYPGSDRRRRLTRRIGGETGAGVALSIVLVLATTGFLAVQRLADTPTPNADPAFAGTPLADATVQGKWMQVLVNDFGSQFTTVLQDTEDFYRAAEQNVYEEVGRAELPANGDGLTTVLLVEGLKCNTGMMRVVGSVADELDPAFVLSAGDDSLETYGLERFCVDALASALDGHDLVVAPGNHDSPASQRAMRDHGFTVLSGTPVTHAGLRILGDAHPARTPTARAPVRPTTVEEMARQLASVACTDLDGIDITVVNQPAGLQQVVRRGCTRLAVAGGITQDYSVRSVEGRKFSRYLQASTGGAVYDGSGGILPTLGSLQAPAELTLLTFDATSHKPLQFQVVTVDVDRSASVSAPTLLPYGATQAGQRKLAKLQD